MKRIRWSAVALLIPTACSGPGTTDEGDLARARAALWDGSNAGFEHTLTENRWGKYDSVCVLQVRDAEAPLTIEVTHLNNGRAEYGKRVGTWTGTDFLDTAYGKPKDRIAVSGCSGGPPCTLRVEAISKGNALTDALGCTIRVTDGTTDVLGGDGTGATLTNSFTAGRAQMRQKLLQNPSGTTNLHACRLRLVGEPDEEGSFAGSLRLRRNGEPILSDWTAIGLGPQVYPQSANPAAPWGRGRVGTEGGSAVIHHAAPQGALVPADIVHCAGQMSNAANEPTGEIEFNATVPAADEGIYLDVFPTGNGPTCGDGVRHRPTEACDDGIVGNDDAADGACRTNCVPAFCGDNTTDFSIGEQCDDGNRLNGDGCDSQCLREDCNSPLPGLGSCVRNVIFFIGDGMGAEQLRAARMFLNGDTSPLLFETFPEHAEVVTHAVDGSVTDSAAAGTAMATGHKVDIGVISIDIPGTGSDLTTVLESYSAAGKRTGLITIIDSVLHATPAAFGAHTSDRNLYGEIASDLLGSSRPNILFGAAHASLSTSAFAASGYTVVTSAPALGNLNPDSVSLVLGVFGDAAPTLAARTSFALDLLEEDPDGFFLMVEHAGPDKSGHTHDLPGVIDGVVKLEEAVQVAVGWASSRNDTLILVGADHETGGLTITETTPTPGTVPDHVFTDTYHTGVAVPFFAWGPTSQFVSGVLDNTEIYSLLSGAAALPRNVALFQQGVNGYASATDTWLQQAAPATSHATSSQLSVDADDPFGTGQQNHALLQFSDLFGMGPGQVPPSSTIVSAALVLEVSNAGAAVSAHEMLIPWSDADTWASFGTNGIQAGVEAGAAPVSTTVGLTEGTVLVDVTSSLQAWIAAPSLNHGWVLLPTGNDGAEFESAEGSIAPRLQIVYR